MNIAAFVRYGFWICTWGDICGGVCKFMVVAFDFLKRAPIDVAQSNLELLTLL
jgi:hypothetical protein